MKASNYLFKSLKNTLNYRLTLCFIEAHVWEESQGTRQGFYRLIFHPKLKEMS